MNSPRHPLPLVLVCAGLLLPLLSGCASIVRGGGESISIQSSPSGAEVRLSTGQSGVTPFSTEVQRKDGTIFVTMTKKGYKELNTALVPSLDGGSLGAGTVANFLFFPIVNDLVDYSTRANYSHKPNPLIATLIPTDSPESYSLVVPPGAESRKATAPGPAAPPPTAPPQGSQPAREGHKGGLGLSVKMTEGSLVVSAVQPDSAAAGVGIRAGDAIISYNRVAAAEAGQVLEGVINSPMGTTATVAWRSADGTKKTAELDWSPAIVPAPPPAEIKSAAAGGSDLSAAAAASPAAAPPRSEEETGLGLKVDAQNGRIWVREVRPDSAAARAGIQPDDEILGYNGLSPANQSRWLAASINRPNDRSATIAWRDKDGEMRTLKLEW